MRARAERGAASTRAPIEPRVAAETESQSQSVAPVERTAALWPRFAAAIYEAVLLFAVAFAAGFALLAATAWTHPLADVQRWALQAVLFVVVGAYFVWCWSRGGQTLAMKSWGLRVVDQSGRPPSARRAALRYVLAWHLFLPGLAWVALAGTSAPVDLMALAASYVAMLFTARLDPQRRLLHDRLAATRVVQA